MNSEADLGANATEAKGHLRLLKGGGQLQEKPTYGQHLSQWHAKQAVGVSPISTDHHSSRIRVWNSDGGAGSRLAATVRRRFALLASEWRRATSFASSVDHVVYHPAYQQIIGLGWDALPFILRELEREREHWYWALACISGEDAAAGARDMESAREAWLEWGRSQGLI